MRLALLAMALASPCVADSPLADSSSPRHRILGRERTEHKDERREEKRLKRLKRKERNGSKPGHGHHSPKSPGLKSQGLKSPDRVSPFSSKTSKSYYNSSPENHKSWSSSDDSPKPTPQPTKDEEHGWWGAWPAEHATDAPTEKPTKKPTKSPTRRPTKRPTKGPTGMDAPTENPTKRPTKRPTNKPTRPTAGPTKNDQFHCYESPEYGGTWPVCPGEDDEDFCNEIFGYCDDSVCDCNAGQLLCSQGTNLCDPDDVFLIVNDGKGYRIPDGNDYNWAAVVDGSKLHVSSGARVEATNVLRSESAILVSKGHLEVQGEDIEVIGAQGLGGNGIDFITGSKGHVGCAEVESPAPTTACDNAGILIAGGQGGDYATGGTALGAYNEGTVVHVRGATLRAGAGSAPGGEGYALHVWDKAKVTIHAGDIEGNVLVEGEGHLVVHGGYFVREIMVRDSSTVHFRGCFGTIRQEAGEEYDLYVFPFVGNHNVKTMINLLIHVDSPDPQFTILSC